MHLLADISVASVQSLQWAAIYTLGHLSRPRRRASICSAGSSTPRARASWQPRAQRLLASSARWRLHRRRRRIARESRPPRGVIAGRRSTETSRVVSKRRLPAVVPAQLSTFRCCRAAQNVSPYTSETRKRGSKLHTKAIAEVQLPGLRKVLRALRARRLPHRARVDFAQR